MADTGRMEQAIEALHAFEAGSIVPPLITLSHPPIVIEHAARVDELVVGADKCQQFSAARPEVVERAERVCHVGDVAGPGFSHLRVRETLAAEADGAPFRRWRRIARIDQVPFELGDAERERSGPIENGEVATAVQPEPDAIAML